MDEYITVRVVRERTGPSKTAFTAKSLSPGTRFPVIAVTEYANERWLQRADRPDIFICEHIGDEVYCAKLARVRDDEWEDAIDAWARSLGNGMAFTGVQRK